MIRAKRVIRLWVSHQIESNFFKKQVKNVGVFAGKRGDSSPGWGQVQCVAGTARREQRG